MISKVELLQGAQKQSELKHNKLVRNRPKDMW